ncbi:MAG: alkaline phosphatase family protein [Candidatus Aminicenantes bacterium]|nr:alkaline phosphatase family protein [Candidatus Aminicenantes bacterium]
MTFFDKKKSKEGKKVVIFGLDGIPYDLMLNLGHKKIMPETKKLIEKGIFMQMESSIPEISSVAWSSIITGKNPGEHGIFGYTDIPPGTYRVTFPNFNSLKAPSFWHKNPDEKSIILNVPATFPAKPLNGVHVSGFIALDLERSVFPKALIPKLIELDYKIDVDAAMAHKSMELFLRDLERTFKARIALYRYLWEEAWDNFMFVITETDRLCHFLWDAYENENNKYHSFFLNFFHQIDEVVGEIAEKVSEEDILVILSDHGFELLESDVNLNFYLKENGLLNLKPDSKRNFADIDYGTKAFALEPSRIYINLKGKYPRGSVAESDYKHVREEIIMLFAELEFKGKKAIKKIHKKEEIYQGPHISLAPDIVLIPEKGFNLKANLNVCELFEKSIFTGKHTQPDAFLWLNKCLDTKIIPEKLSVADVCKIIDKLKIQPHDNFL